MSKIMDKLNKQLKMEEYKKDAQECIKLYNKLLEINNGKVWSSQWQVMVSVKYLGKYPSCIPVYKLLPLGRCVIQAKNQI